MRACALYLGLELTRLKQLVRDPRYHGHVTSADAVMKPKPPGGSPDRRTAPRGSAPRAQPRGPRCGEHPPAVCRAQGSGRIQIVGTGCACGLRLQAERGGSRDWPTKARKRARSRPSFDSVVAGPDDETSQWKPWLSLDPMAGGSG